MLRSIFGFLLLSLFCQASQVQVYPNGILRDQFALTEKLNLPASLTNAVSKLSQRKILEAFRQAQLQPLPFEYIKDCCFERGYRISQFLYKSGIRHLRVIVRGDFKLLKDKWGRDIQWLVHTSPAVVDTHNRLWVFDPALAQRPLLVRDWLLRFVKSEKNLQISVGTQYVYAESDITSSITYDNFQRADVEEVVSGGLLGCQYIQDRENRLQRTPNSEGCQILSQQLDHTKKHKVSDFWAQEMAGLDLAKEWLKEKAKTQRLHQPIVHIWDEDLQERRQVSHSYSVRSFFEPGPQASTERALLGKHVDVIYDFRGYIQGSQELISRSQTQLVNLSAGWRSYTDSIKQSLDRVIRKNTVIVKAAGNSPLRGSSDAEYEPERSDLVRVGSVSADGLISDFSAIRGDWIIHAPSDRSLTARAAGQFSPFDGTSGAAPLVTGAVANYLALYPKASLQQIQTSLIDSAFEMNDDSGLIHHYTLNAFRLLFAGLEENEKREANGIISLQALKARDLLVENFPQCFGYVSTERRKTSSCQSQTQAVRHLRRLFYFEPSRGTAESLACLYRQAGFHKQAEFFENWLASQRGELGTLLSTRALSREAVARNARLMKKNDLRRIFGRELTETLNLKSTVGIVALLRTDLAPGLVERQFESLKTQRDREKFLEFLIAVPDIRRDIFRLAHKKHGKELSMTLLDAFYNTEDRDLIESLMPLLKTDNERVWMKMANFMDYYLPEVRQFLGPMLMQKPSEEVQHRILEFTYLMSVDELREVLKRARESDYASVRELAFRFRTP